MIGQYRHIPVLPPDVARGLANAVSIWMKGLPHIPSGKATNNAIDAQRMFGDIRAVEAFASMVWGFEEWKVCLHVPRPWQELSEEDEERYKQQAGGVARMFQQQGNNIFAQVVKEVMKVDRELGKMLEACKGETAESFGLVS